MRCGAHLECDQNTAGHWFTDEHFSHPEGRDAVGFSVFTTERLEILDHEAAAHTVLNRDWVAITL